MTNKIYLSSIALEEIIRSAYETLEVECVGNLFGERRENKNYSSYFVESAHPIQIAKRKNDEVKYSVRTPAEWCVLHKFIGDFHSHFLDDKEKKGLSKEDIEGLRETPEQIALLVYLREIKRKSEIKEDSLLISGYLFWNSDENYRFDIAGYYLDEGRIRRAKIFAPKKLIRRINNQKI